MAAGIRDAANLCWKLAAVLRGKAAEELLDSYELERKPHVRDTTRRSVVAGRIITEKHRPLAILRNQALRAAMRTPWLGDFIYEARFLPKTELTDGVLSDRKVKARGSLVPQPSVASSRHEAVPLDDLLGFDWAVITCQDSRAVTPEARERWRALGARIFELVDREELSKSELRDLDGALDAWMDRHGLQAVAVRPDRVVYAVGDERHPLPDPPAVYHS
jgi:3-(3-hydroxy-phenyl)propionate hydroxylase